MSGRGVQFNGQEKERIIGVLNIDSFECQVWQKKSPHLKGRPCAVADMSGRILSVSLEAKKEGVERMQRVVKAKEICPKLEVFVKPNRYGKPENEESRLTSWVLNDVIHELVRESTNIVVETVFPNQWYFDLTDYTREYKRNIVEAIYMDKGCSIILEDEFRQCINQEVYDYLSCGLLSSEDVQLLKGAKFISSLIKNIFKMTGFTCSGGVSANLFLAKIACNFNIPGKITAMNKNAWDRVSLEISAASVKALGKKTGKRLRELFGIDSMYDLKTISSQDLLQHFTPEEASMILNCSRGVCNIPVVDKSFNYTVVCRKTNLDINSNFQLRCELDNRCEEMIDRLDLEWERYQRVPKSLKLKMKFCKKVDRRNIYSEEFPLWYSCTDSIPQLVQQCFEKIVLEGKFDLYGSHTITCVQLSARNFIMEE